MSKKSHKTLSCLIVTRLSGNLPNDLIISSSSLVEQLKEMKSSLAKQLKELDTKHKTSFPISPDIELSIVTMILEHWQELCSQLDQSIKVNKSRTLKSNCDKSIRNINSKVWKLEALIEGKTSSDCPKLYYPPINDPTISDYYISNIDQLGI